MARNKKSDGAVPSSIAAHNDTPTVALASVAPAPAPDAFIVASREADHLYQRIKEGDSQAVVELRALSTVMRLKMSLLAFKHKMARASNG